MHEAYIEAKRHAVMSDMMLIMAMRDVIRKTPLADGCDHDLHELPVIDARIDYQCAACHGVQGVYADGTPA